ncbi:protein CDV3 homolog [Diorhabda carinulata]|uniref:protein CDV3 homolog n=1 Tax=Diorhabda sublineata TaxID=1163346 RepID=UPI0024E13B33|nr:protein CDV3 homolog [Diorhabda sublineata]XP_057656188.1 protein CDV3 homolog [Diorhabda carinulata]
MADLDDFFAKKDRKKSKATKKYATAEEVAKKLEDSAKKTEKLKKERVNEEEDTIVTEQDQDEWKEFEEEKKDYTGLKIGNLTIGQNVESSNTGAKEISEQQPEDEPGQETEKKSGPWKRIDVTEVEVEKVEVKTDPILPNVSKTGAYIPPSMRGSGGQTHVQPTRLNRSKAAPDIHNEEFFPSLSGDHKKNRNEGSFEVVQSSRSTSHRQVEQSKMNSTQGPKLSLGNRYNTLSNDS